MKIYSVLERSGVQVWGTEALRCPAFDIRSATAPDINASFTHLSMSDQNLSRPPTRPIRRLLIANRGEIATRILSAVREFDPSIETYTLATEDDSSHTFHSFRVLRLVSPTSYLSIDELVGLVKKHKIDAIHPGYGFLSESAEFSRRAWGEAGAVVIGPGWNILEQTGDKLRARSMAVECNVPVLPATERSVGQVKEVREFAERVGLPIMVKAVDGGGGRGIRLIKGWNDLENLVKRAIQESPSREVFVEKAALDGFRHVEVQIVGDGDQVQHLWERECSIQRRYQKIVELAPSTIRDRRVVVRIIEAALHMARKLQYFSLGTFEFLCNPSTSEYYFLEVNPRLQVEHTVTESIAGIDLVKVQLQIACGLPLNHTTMCPRPDKAEPPPHVSAIQLRITAENVHSNWSLSIGKISSFHFPSGNGIRVDTHLVSGHTSVVTANFDSLIAKIIVTAATWEDVVQKAKRALQDVHIDGIRTNIDALRGILAQEAFIHRDIDTSWLEKNLPSILETGQNLGSAVSSIFFNQSASNSSTTAQGLSGGSVLLRKNDSWAMTLTPLHNPSQDKGKEKSLTQHIKLDRIQRNEFPTHLSAQIAYTTPTSAQPLLFALDLSATSASSTSVIAQGKFRRGDPTNLHHVIIPFSGVLVEVLVDEGDVLKAGDVVCVIRQMKMELEVRAPRAGKVVWITEAEDGEDVAEGVLAVELEEVEEGRDAGLKSRL